MIIKFLINCTFLLFVCKVSVSNVKSKELKDFLPFSDLSYLDLNLQTG